MSAEIARYIIIFFFILGCAPGSHELEPIPMDADLEHGIYYVHQDGSCQSVAAYTAIYALGQGLRFEIVYGVLHYEDGHDDPHVHTRVLWEDGWRWARLVDVGLISFDKELWTEFEELQVYNLTEFLYRVQSAWAKGRSDD